MMMLRMLTTAALAALLATGTGPARAYDKHNPLDGGYTIVKGEKNGQKIPVEEIEGTMVRIADNGIIVTDKGKKTVYATSYKIEDESAAGPWKITMTSKLAPHEGTKAKGLIQKKGDNVMLIYALPGGEAPTEFKTKERQLMFVLKNRNEDKKD